MKNVILAMMAAVSFSLSAAHAGQETYGGKAGVAPALYKDVYQCGGFHTAQMGPIVGGHAPVIVTDGKDLFVKEAPVVPNPVYSYAKLTQVGANDGQIIYQDTTGQTFVVTVDALGQFVSAVLSYQAGTRDIQAVCRPASNGAQ
jgi:hypothetical protein